MAELENIMNQLYGARNKSVQGTYRTMNKLFEQANRQSTIAKGMITTELEIGKQSNSPENIDSAIDNINSIIGQNSNDSLIVGLGEASVRSLNEKKALIDEDTNIRTTAADLLRQSSNIKNLDPKDQKSFEDGLESLKISAMENIHSPDTDKEVREMIGLLEERNTNVKLAKVMEETDPHTKDNPRNVAQNLIQDTYSNLFENLPDEYKRSIAVKGSEAIMNYSNEFFTVDATRNVALAKMKDDGSQTFDDWREVGRRRIESLFRNIGHNISAVKSYVPTSPIRGLNIEGGFDDDALMNPQYFPNLLYQLGRFIENSLPEDLRQEAQEAAMGAGEYDPNLQSYSFKHIQNMYDVAMREMPNKRGAFQKYYKAFEDKDGKDIGTSSKHREAFYSSLFGSITDAYTLYGVIIEQQNLEREYTNPGVGVGAEDVPTTIGPSKTKTALGFPN